jgi:hypothetical protein
MIDALPLTILNLANILNTIMMFSHQNITKMKVEDSKLNLQNRGYSKAIVRSIKIRLDYYSMTLNGNVYNVKQKDRIIIRSIKKK